ncbi:putative prophage PSSB64-02, tail length tape-measure protein [Pseudomonas syringae pv. atrofaciens]|uniref:phage tail tape measure protein n=1 Tax=Pseudomonas syringae TaxID=317 RepID=UPI000F002C49|nr:phage tail tape measure protein [Pseudomonas syringae]RMP49310.1 putative prophage PSSB64-02, tail length tape-measure protein [Pseudomonas syringae pv. atrofaciens]
MALTSRLAIEVDSRSAEQKVQDLRRSLEALNNAGVRTGPVMSGAGGAINDTGRSSRSAATQVQGLDRTVRSLASAAAGLAGPLLAAFATKSLYDASEAYSTLTNRMKLVTSNATELAAAQKAVFSIAQSAYQPLTATAELYQRIATNQKELKLTGEGVAGVVGTISKTLAISGASAASANAALIQLGQAFASGVLRGEELNSVMEQAPALAQAIAAGMGKTVGELRSLGAAGLLTADAVVKALQAQRGAVDALFARTSATIGNSLTALGNSTTSFIGQLDQATGSSASLAKSILSLSSAIDGGLPAAIKLATDNSEELGQVLTTGLYVALARVAGGFAQQAAQAGYAAVANQKALTVSAASSTQDLASAKSKQVDAKAAVDRANAQVASAKRQVAADKEVMASEINRTRAVQAALVAERETEVQRLKAQISDQGRAASLNRLAELSRAHVVVTNQVNAAERALAATTVSSSATIAAAYRAKTAAVAAYGETTVVVNAATIASNNAAAAASLTSRALGGLTAAGTGLLSMLGGPLGLLFIAGAVAVSFMDFRSSSDKVNEGLQNLKGPLDDVIARFKQLTKDQQAAALVKWGETQAEAAKAANEEFQNLNKSLQAGLVGPRSSAAGTKIFSDYSAQIASAREAGESLTPIFEKLRSEPGVPESLINSLVKSAGAYSGLSASAKEAKDRIAALKTESANAATTAALSTGATNVMTGAGKKYNEELQKQLGKLQDNNDAVKEANRYIAEHKDLTEADKVAILSTANALKSQEAANKAAAKATREAGKAYTESAGTKALDDARKQYAVLGEQSAIIKAQRGDTEKLGAAATELIKWEQQLANIKSKQTLTADQKSLVANQDLVTAQLRRNAALEKENQLSITRLENESKLKAFRENLDSQLGLAKDGLDSELAGAGLGDQARQRLQDDLKIRQSYQKDLDKLSRDYNKITNPTSADTSLYQNETNALNAALQTRLAMQRQYYTDVDRAQSDWALGASSALENYLEQSRDVAGQTKQLFTNAFSGMEDAVVNFVKTGKLSFKDFANGVIEDLIRIQVRQAAAGFLSTAFSALSGLGGTGGLAAGSAGAASSKLGASASGYGSKYGFSDGGYTGDGGKFQPKGVVHGGEFVVKKDVVSQPGAREFLERMNANTKGYADGGYVGKATTTAASSSAQPTASPSANGPAIHQSFQFQGTPDESTLSMVKDAAYQGAKGGYEMVMRDFKINGPIRQLAARR